MAEWWPFKLDSAGKNRRLACRAEQRRHGGHADIRQELILQIKSPTPHQPDLKLNLTEVSASGLSWLYTVRIQ